MLTIILKEPIQDTTFITTSIVKSSSHHTPYALIENDNFYLVKSHTLGVRDKKQVDIEIDDNDRSVKITAESVTQVEENGTMIRNDSPSKFELKINLQKTILIISM
ncbi:hypothetical protein RhiirB3_384155 [Rhizophagus irregularis]|nr:hypothetical protein RhiirB3_384155 [Rhizophagus irregularis]